MSQRRNVVVSRQLEVFRAGSQNTLRRRWMRQTLVLRRLLYGVSGLLFALTSIGLLLIVMDNDKAVRARYALISEAGSEKELTRPPDRPPSGFVIERGRVPDELAKAVESLDLDEEDDAYRKAVSLAAHIASGPGPGKGELDIDVVSTYRAVISDRYGDCTDYARLFAGLGYAAGLDTRIWTTSFEGFGSVGHVFSEFYSPESGWLFLDPINSFVVVDERTRQPLSVAEFRNRLLLAEESRNLVVEPISERRFGFDSAEQAIEYYRRGADRFALRMANDVLSYDELPWVRLLGPQFRWLEQGLSIAFDKYPHLMILETPNNRQEMQDLRDLRKQVLVLLAGWLLSGAVMLAIGVCWLYRRSQNRAQSLTLN
jgi:hypothetical protein